MSTCEEFQVVDAEGDVWAWTDSLAEALHYLSQEPDGHIEKRTVGPWERLGGES